MTNQVKSRSAINNRSLNQNVFDRISALLKEVKKNSSQKDTGGNFFGFVLYVNRITPSRFRSLFGNNSDFYEQTLISSGVTEVKNSGTFLELFVDIPELTGFFPRPDLKIIMDIVKNKDAIEEAASPLGYLLDESARLRSEAISAGVLPEATPARQNRANKKDEARRKAIDGVDQIADTMKIISMYPRIYRYSESNEFYPMGTACEVELPYENLSGFPTMGYGYFKKSIGGLKRVDGEGLNEAIKKIIEENKK